MPKPRTRKPATTEEIIAPRPTELPGLVGEGVEKPSFPEVDELATKYFGFAQRRKDLKQGADEASENLIQAMIKHDVTFYETPDSKIVTVKHGKIKVAVKKLGEREHE